MSQEGPGACSGLAAVTEGQPAGVLRHLGFNLPMGGGVGSAAISKQVSGMIWSQGLLKVD